jgi:hypothetical protein
MHGPSVCGYALVSANLVPSYGLNSSSFVDGEGNSIMKPPLGKVSGENPKDKSSLGPVKFFLCFQERSYTRS